MIEVKHIDKSFGDKAVLRDINAVFDDGKTNLIIVSRAQARLC